MDEMDGTKLREELVAILTEGFMRYIKSERYAEDVAIRQKAPDTEAAYFEFPPK